MIAPVDISKLPTAEYTEGTIEFSRSMARRADIINSNLEAWVKRCPMVPAQNGIKARWCSRRRTQHCDRPCGERGHQRNHCEPSNRVIATVAVRVLNSDGQQEWANEFKGYAFDELPDGPYGALAPVVRATFDAFDTASWG